MKNLLFKKWDFSRKENIFCSCIFFFYFVALLFGFILDGRIVEYYLFGVSDTNDTFMDFFNSIVETQLLQHCNNYPPLALFFYQILGYLTPFKNVNTVVQNRPLAFELRGSIYGSMMNMFIILIFSFSFYFIIKEILKKTEFSEVKKTIVSLVILCSGPVIYGIERGNIILFSLLFLLLFFLYKDSDNQKLKYFAFFALAISANLKYYPALFGLVLIKEKRYRDALITAVIGLFVFIFSLIAFKLAVNHHFHKSIFDFSLIEEIKICFLAPVGFSTAQAGGIFAGSSYTSIQNVGNGVVKFIDHFINKTHKETWRSVIPSIFAVWTFIVAVYVFFQSNEKWIQYYGLSSIVCLCFNSASGFYTIMFLSIPLVYYFISKENSKVISLAFGIMFSFVAFPIRKNIDNRYPFILGYVIPEICLLFLFLYSFLRTVFENIQKTRKYVVKFTIASLAILIIPLVHYISKYNRNYTRVFGRFSGNGTIEKPYEISNSDEIVYLSKIVNDGVSTRGLHFVQMSDIDFEGRKFTPIGICESGNYFRGTYDGRNHKIKNIYIYSKVGSARDYVGLFGCLAGSVSNLIIESGTIKGVRAGSIASWGVNQARITNCVNHASIIGDEGYVGGIAYNLGDGIIENCKNYGLVNGKREWSVLGYNSGKVSNIFPVYLPDSFTGKFEYEFAGEGTLDNPYEISSKEDLFAFSTLVNTGFETKNVFFKQTMDIDLENVDWRPIGEFTLGNYFEGVYDGSGYVIKNIYCDSKYAGNRANVGLFGNLLGQVMNLGIESGYFKGACVGAITSQGNEKTLIENCFNKAELVGIDGRAGGICDNVGKGTVKNCINYGICNGKLGPVVSYGAMYKINCTSIEPDSH